jgi:PAS domain S-box-containing protein
VSVSVSEDKRRSDSARDDRPWLAPLLFVLVLLLILGGAAAWYAAQRARTSADVRDTLAAIATLKTSEIVAWRDQLLVDARSFEGDSLANQRLARYLAASYPTGLATMRTWLVGTVRDQGYAEGWILGPNGEVRASTTTESVGADARALIQAVLRSGEPTLTELYLGPDGRPYLDVMAPLRVGPLGSQPVGMIVVREDPGHYLYPLIQSWPLSSTTGETLLVRQVGNDALYLNDLRHRKRAALRLRLPARPGLAAGAAFRGQTSGDFIDYMNVPVVAAMRRVPGTDWFAIAKMARSEAFASLDQLTLATLVGLAALMALAALAVALGWRSRLASARAAEAGEAAGFSEALNRVNKSIYSTHDFDEMMQASLDEGVATLGVDTAIVESRQDESWRVDCQVGFLVEDLGRTLSDAEAPIATETARTRQPLAIAALRGDERFDAGFASSQEPESVLAVPLIADDAVTGCLLFYRMEARKDFSAPEMDFARQLAATLSLAMANRALLDRVGETRALLQSVFDATSDAIYVKDLEGRYLLFNRGVELVTGKSADEVMGRDDTFLFPAEEAAVVMEGDRAVIAGGVTETYEERLTAADGELRVYSSTKGPVRDATDQVYGLFGIARDVTDSRRTLMELEHRTEELERSNAELERFAYVASHDLQEPLRMVASYTQLLQKRYEGQLDADADVFIGFAVEGAVRLQRLIDDLLTYSRVGTRGLELEVTDSGDAFRAAARNLERLIADNGAVVASGPLPTVLADPTQLVQLFQNLIGNAIKFHGEAPPEVRVSAEADGAMWRFSVQDNGIGIDPKYFERVFVVFQRLHSRAEYEGSGIGLAICKRIVERHGGHISIESEPGSGTKFTFTLPAVMDGKKGD